ncbi:MAG: Hpt domain-containing protein [Deltaproteobacteria bacterium]|nr:Hpt domain-containing protein [Deltaproteobacteria bacterium]
MASELLEEFIFDSRDHLSTAGVQLLELEKNPDSLENINSLLGTLHTIKGNSGFVNQKNLYSTLHAAENLLQTVRETPDHLCPPNIINQLFQVLDTIEAILSRLENDHDDKVDWLPSLKQAIAEAQTSLEEITASHNEAALRPDQPESPPQSPSSGVSINGDGVSVQPESVSKLVSSILSADGTLADSCLAVTLSDGQLTHEAEAGLEGLVSLFQKGLKSLVFDLSELTSFTAREMEFLIDVNHASEGRLALVLDPEVNPDFWRVFSIWEFDNSFRFFSDQEQALESFRAD